MNIIVKYSVLLGAWLPLVGIAQDRVAKYHYLCNGIDRAEGDINMRRQTGVLPLGYATLYCGGGLVQGEQGRASYSLIVCAGRSSKSNESALMQILAAAAYSTVPMPDSIALPTSHALNSGSDGTSILVRDGGEFEIGGDNLQGEFENCVFQITLPN